MSQTKIVDNNTLEEDLVKVSIKSQLDNSVRIFIND